MRSSSVGVMVMMMMKNPSKLNSTQLNSFPSQLQLAKPSTSSQDTILLLLYILLHSSFFLSLFINL